MTNTDISNTLLWALLLIIAVALLFKWRSASQQNKNRARVRKEEEEAYPGKRQTHCPVMNVPIQTPTKHYADTEDGRRIYMCCGDCVRTFQKDPDLYV